MDCRLGMTRRKLFVLFAILNLIHLYIYVYLLFFTFFGAPEHKGKFDDFKLKIMGPGVRRQRTRGYKAKN